MAAAASLTSPGGPSRSIPIGHSRRIKYANAQDLPSYPSSGLKEGGAAASAAASLGWAHAAAADAASGDTKLSPPQESHPATPGSQAALLAASWAQRHQKQLSSPPSAWGASAANLAFRASKTPPPPQSSESRSLTRRSSMHAAKGAMARLRPRSRSSPEPATETYPDQANAAANALSAATIAHRPSMRPRTVSASEVGAVPYTTMDRQMFTSNPPVGPETDEQKRVDTLHASALAMAKSMFDQQQRMIDNSTRAHRRSVSFPIQDTGRLPTSGGDEQPLMVGNNLQEAAYRLAQERLSRLQEEHQKQRNLHEYYGSSGTPQRSRFGSIRGKLTRKRSSSDGAVLEDQRRSERIRRQMSLLSNKLTEVDEEKRARDRAALLATAQRNVKAQMQDMDEKLQSETGRIPQTSMSDWERKARVAAQARFDAANQGNLGKVDIGGGKFMDRSAVEQIAAKKVQPLLDEINERAEKENERKEQERMDEERRREEAERDKMRDKEIQEIHRKLKDQQREGERARKVELKQDQKIRKDEAKAIKAEHKQERTQREKENETLPLATIVTRTATGQPESEIKESTGIGNRVRGISINFPKRQSKAKAKGKEPSLSPPKAKPPPRVTTDTDSTRTPTSPKQKVRAWLLSRLPRSRTKPSPTGGNPDPSADDNDAKQKGFIGGVALARLQGRDVSSSRASSIIDDNGSGRVGSGGEGGRKGKHSSASAASAVCSSSSGSGSGPSIPRSSGSMREVAMAGRGVRSRGGDERGESSKSAAASIPASAKRSLLSRGGVSVSDEEGEAREERAEDAEVSSLSGDDEFVEARSGLESPLTPSPPRTQPRLVVLPTVAATGRASPARGSRFSEILE
ncbi:hypothetical protein MMYC01_208992 [Madurella mycetomatis]|uniref:Eisosome protein 1 n=1 Tax=Madurella mycetomatis TaxID=100816 RepID=A0A175VVG7_9PEZI|nr:hypothetical protein MMYC01_208992 [Madurella mycetomatis]